MEIQSYKLEQILRFLEFKVENDLKNRLGGSTIVPDSCFFINFYRPFIVSDHNGYDNNLDNITLDEVVEQFERVEKIVRSNEKVLSCNGVAKELASTASLQKLAREYRDKSSHIKKLLAIQKSIARILREKNSSRNYNTNEENLLSGLIEGICNGMFEKDYSKKPSNTDMKLITYSILNNISSNGKTTLITLDDNLDYLYRNVVKFLTSPSSSLRIESMIQRFKEHPMYLLRGTQVKIPDYGDTNIMEFELLDLIAGKLRLKLNGHEKALAKKSRNFSLLLDYALNGKTKIIDSEETYEVYYDVRDSPGSASIMKKKLTSSGNYYSKVAQDFLMYWLNDLPKTEQKEVIFKDEKNPNIEVNYNRNDQTFKFKSSDLTDEQLHSFSRYINERSNDLQVTINFGDPINPRTKKKIKLGKKQKERKKQDAIIQSSVQPQLELEEPVSTPKTEGKDYNKYSKSELIDELVEQEELSQIITEETDRLKKELKTKTQYSKNLENSVKILQKRLQDADADSQEVFTISDDLERAYKAWQSSESNLGKGFDDGTKLSDYENLQSLTDEEQNHYKEANDIIKNIKNPTIVEVAREEKEKLESILKLRKERHKQYIKAKNENSKEILSSYKIVIKSEPISEELLKFIFPIGLEGEEEGDLERVLTMAANDVFESRDPNEDKYMTFTGKVSKGLYEYKKRFIQKVKKYTNNAPLNISFLIEI